MLAMAAAVVAFVLAVGGVVREVGLDGYGRRTPRRPGAVDPSRDWSPDLPSRPYREM